MIGEVLCGKLKSESCSFGTLLGPLELRSHTALKRIHRVRVYLKIRPDSALQHFAGSAIGNVGGSHFNGQNIVM